MKSMIVTNTLQYKRLIRMRNLGLVFQTVLSEGAAAVIIALAQILNTLATLAGSQVAAAGRAVESARVKAKAREALKDAMLFISRIAEVLAVETPGFDSSFQMPARGDARLLASARSFAELAAPYADAFIRHTVPPTFIEDLKQHIELFEKASKDYADAVHTCTEVANSVAVTLEQASTTAAHLDAIVRNSIHDPIQTADWDRACELGRKSVKSPKVETPVEATPAPTPPLPEGVAA